MHKMVDMLSYKRPEGSETQDEFCKRFLEPVFGKADKYGNYIKFVGQKPNICFTAHHDTVHKDGGRQKVIVRNDIVTVDPKSGSNCLGADCTSGIYLILEMIKAKVPGVYVVHAAEEIGCIGSRNLVHDEPNWMLDLNAVISFDRKGQESIITHQMGMRTCSDNFAVSLANILNLNLRPDDTGSYTDSNEYAGLVSECTNVSVGYLAQHTAKESQDLFFLDTLRDALVTADWSKLVFERNQYDIEYLNHYQTGFYNYRGGEEIMDDAMDKLYDIVLDHPYRIAEWLNSMGVNHTDLVEELDLPVGEYINKYWS
jgi:hypothetical protein